MLPILLLKLTVGLLPIFNIEKGCRTDTEGAQEDKSAYQICVRDEQAAKTKVASEWTGYPMVSRRTCASEQIDGYTGSYVELMTCLEIQDWKTHLTDTAGPTGGELETLGGAPAAAIQTSGYSARNPLGWSSDAPSQ